MGIKQACNKFMFPPAYYLTKSQNKTSTGTHYRYNNPKEITYLQLHGIDRLRECISLSLAPVEDKANIQSNTKMNRNTPIPPILLPSFFSSISLTKRNHADIKFPTNFKQAAFLLSIQKKWFNNCLSFLFFKKINSLSSDSNYNYYILNWK